MVGVKSLFTVNINVFVRLSTSLLNCFDVGELATSGCVVTQLISHVSIVRYLGFERQSLQRPARSRQPWQSRLLATESAVLLSIVVVLEAFGLKKNFASPLRVSPIEAASGLSDLGLVSIHFGLVAAPVLSIFGATWPQEDERVKKRS